MKWGMVPSSIKGVSVEVVVVESLILAVGDNQDLNGDLVLLMKLPGNYVMRRSGFGAAG